MGSYDAGVTPRRPLVVLVLVLVVLALAPSAGAHTQVQRATPGPGETVEGDVAFAELEFLDPVLPTPTIEVTGPDGSPVAGLGEARLVADDLARVEFDPLVAAGTYRVDYTFVALDGDEQTAAHTFTFRPAPTPTETPTETETEAATGAERPPTTGAAPVTRSSDGEGSGLLPITLDAVRTFLHVLAATVWVGGQLTLAGLVPGLRALGPDVPGTVARRFNRIAWPAYAVLLATGVWNLAESPLGDRDTAWQMTLFVKLVVVALSGASAATHAMAASKVVLAVGGAVAGLSSLAALFLGVQLATG